MTKTKFLIGAALFSFASFSAFAEGPYRGLEVQDHGRYDQRGYDRGGYEERNIDRQNEIDRRIDRAQERINRGVRYGQLTHHERRNLNAELHQIRRARNDMVRDGRMNREEFARLTDWLDRLSAKVREEKHDGDRRYHGRPW